MEATNSKSSTRITVGQLRALLKKAGAAVHGPKLLVARDEDEVTEKTKGGIILVEQQRKVQRYGTLVLMGYPIDDETATYMANLETGMGVALTNYGTSEFEVPIPGLEKPVMVEMVHVRDVYLTYKGKGEDTIIRQDFDTEATGL